jgi:hypothetical protein
VAMRAHSTHPPPTKPGRLTVMTGAIIEARIAPCSPVERSRSAMGTEVAVDARRLVE